MVSEPLRRARPQRALRAVAVLGGMGLCACSERVDAPPAATAAATARAAPAAASATAASAASTAPRAGVTVSARIHPSLPEMTFTLVAEPPAEAGAVLKVRAIEIRRNGAADLAQRIEGLSTETPSSAEAPGLTVADLDFDGYADIRLVAAQPAGPDVPYRHWLFQAATGQFVAAPALDALGSPQPDAAKQELRVDWRDGAARSGSDFYAWQAGSPVLVRKAVRQYSGPGAYTLTVSALEHGAWRVLQTKKMREP